MSLCVFRSNHCFRHQIHQIELVFFADVVFSCDLICTCFQNDWVFHISYTPSKKRGICLVVFVFSATILACWCRLWMSMVRWFWFLLGLPVLLRCVSSFMFDSMNFQTEAEGVSSVLILFLDTFGDLNQLLSTIFPLNLRHWYHKSIYL